MDHDATQRLTSYAKDLAPKIMDLRSIEALIGRVEVKGQWWIIDRFLPILTDADEEAEVDDYGFLDN